MSEPTEHDKQKAREIARMQVKGDRWENAMAQALAAEREGLFTQADLDTAVQRERTRLEGSVVSFFGGLLAMHVNLSDLLAAIREGEVKE